MLDLRICCLGGIPFAVSTHLLEIVSPCCEPIMLGGGTVSILHAFFSMTFSVFSHLIGWSCLHMCHFNKAILIREIERAALSQVMNTEKVKVVKDLKGG